MSTFTLISDAIPEHFIIYSIALMRVKGLMSGLLLIASLASAQDMAPDTTLFLDDVNIYSSRISRFATGLQVITADSLTRAEYPGGTLSELISGITSAYVRNYGPGTLSTLSVRGTSSNHTGLVWNGIRISPPNIGYLDLSMVQQGFFNDVSVLLGGTSPMYGSGNIAGGIHLENRPVFDQNGFDAGLGLRTGSYGAMGIESSGRVLKKNFYSRTAFNINRSNNDFQYADLSGEQVKMPHADMFRTGFIQDLAFQFKGDQYIMASAWFNYAGREIPPTLTQDVSEAVQTDRSWRLMAIWKDFNEKSNLEAKLAWFNEFTRYDDPPASVFSTIESQTVTGAFEGTFELEKNNALFGGVQYTYEYADLVNYENPQNQQNLALLASYRHAFPSLGWQASVNGRQEFLTDYEVPFLFSAGAEGKIWRFISGRFSVSRNFRAPTLNERYWQPGGNPGLEPEESWNEEIGVMADYKFASSAVSMDLTLYNSNVTNWILWLPGSSYWSVENAQEVWSRGMEATGRQSFDAGNVSVYFTESYTFSKSTNRKKLFNLDASYNKQLIYTPLNRFFVKAGAMFRGYNLALKGNYTGIVYTTKDNLDSLPGYFLMDMVLAKTFNVKVHYPVTIQLNLNNLLNKDYEVIPYRPMPGINGMITVRVGVGEH